MCSRVWEMIILIPSLPRIVMRRARSAGYSLLITIHMHLRGKELVIFSSIILRNSSLPCAHSLYMGSLFSLCAPPALWREDVLKECEMRRFLPSHSIKTPRRWQTPAAHLHFNARCAGTAREGTSRDIFTPRVEKSAPVTTTLRQLTI